MKKMATKLIRLLSEKKKFESNHPGQANHVAQANNNNLAHHRDLETEELIEDQVSSR